MGGAAADPALAEFGGGVIICAGVGNFGGDCIAVGDSAEGRNEDAHCVGLVELVVSGY